MLALIRGAGDLASGIALRLWRSGMDVIMTDLPMPTAIRRTVSFSEALRLGETTLEDIRAVKASSVEEAAALLKKKCIPVLADPNCACRSLLRPDVLVDAILAKRNLGTSITDAPIVIGVGPGFTANVDCHAVVETMRGHTMGRVYYEGSALPNTNIPGLVGGFAGERVLRAPCSGLFSPVKDIGDVVKEGDIVAYVQEEPIQATIGGVIRGLLPAGVHVHKGMKSGDIDPRYCAENCYTVSDKSLAIGGGVLEAMLYLQAKKQGLR